MKPYKIIKPQYPPKRRMRLLNKLKPPKIALRLFKSVHPPWRVVFCFEDDKYEVAPSDGIQEFPRDGVKLAIGDQIVRQQN